MGFRGDAVKVTKDELKALTEVFDKTNALNSSLRQLKVLASGEELEAQRSEILRTSQETTLQRGKCEELERDIARISTDLKLVDDRIVKDNERLKTSTNPKDISGIQHELETLAKRKDELETAELELMEQLDVENQALAQLVEHKRRLEELFEANKSFNAERQKLVQTEILELQNQIAKLRANVSGDLLAAFDQRAQRGVPIGALRGSSCGACNMSLNSQDVAALSRIPLDELARCPECSAILVRG